MCDYYDEYDEYDFINEFGYNDLRKTPKKSKNNKYIPLSKIMISELYRDKINNKYGDILLNININKILFHNIIECIIYKVDFNFLKQLIIMFKPISYETYQNLKYIIKYETDIHRYNKLNECIDLFKINYYNPQMAITGSIGQVLKFYHIQTYHIQNNYNFLTDLQDDLMNKTYSNTICDNNNYIGYYIKDYIDLLFKKYADLYITNQNDYIKINSFIVDTLIHSFKIFEKIFKCLSLCDSAVPHIDFFIEEVLKSIVYKFPSIECTCAEYINKTPFYSIKNRIMNDLLFYNPIIIKKAIKYLKISINDIFYTSYLSYEWRALVSNFKFSLAEILNRDKTKNDIVKLFIDTEYKIITKFDFITYIKDGSFIESDEYTDGGLFIRLQIDNNYYIILYSLLALTLRSEVMPILSVDTNIIINTVYSLSLHNDLSLPHFLIY